jgi:UDP-N-acetylmuramyl pentapeptide phosphotransferase/UDP-N-acetylglucosamine-1-phosphate transferase
MNEIVHVFSNKEFQILVSFFTSLFVAITAIPVIINISKLKDLMAEIEVRSSHEELTPTLGGVAIFAATLIAYFIWDNPNEGHEIHLTVAALIILFFLGIKDDILILAPKKKLYIQIAASLLLISFGNLHISNLYGLLGIYEINYMSSIIFTTFIFISLTNAINLIDGIDGLAGSVGLLSSLIFTYLFFELGLYAMATLSISLAGALMGFLKFNYSDKNKIFMGDTGSLLVGFLLSFFSVKFVAFNSDFIYNPNLGNDSPILVILILIIPLFDTLRVFILRLIEGNSPFKGDRKHMHHILIDLKLSHGQATLLLILFNGLLLALFFIFRHQFANNLMLLILFISFLIYCFIGFILSKNIDYQKIDRIQYTKIDKLKRLQLAEEKKGSTRPNDSATE